MKVMSKKLSSELVSILSDLIGLPSPYPPGTAVEICAYAAKRLKKAGYKVGKDVYLGLDVASSEFFKDGQYELESEERSFTSAQFAKYLADLAQRYPIVTIEDGMSEGDWEGWGLLTRALGEKIQLVGDDREERELKRLASSARAR